MNKQEIVYTNTKEIKCSGDSETFDHPTIYLKLDANQNRVKCLYCSKEYVYLGNNP